MIKQKHVSNASINSGRDFYRTVKSDKVIEGKYNRRMFKDQKLESKGRSAKTKKRSRKT